MATIESYDETDLDDIEFLIGTGERKLDHVAGALAVPSARRSSYLMMLSLLEYICGMHVPEKDKSQRLFKVLCDKLARFDDMTEFFSIDELTRIRSNYLDKFSHIMRKAVTKFLQDEPFISKKNLDILFTPPIDKRFMNNRSYEEAFCVTSSRYSNEFVQMKSLGKGAFGVVFKAKSCLDDQFYAVKRISLHKAHFESWKHLIQESKILAGLKHQNIVGYHTAWLENTQSTDLADRAFLYRGLPSAATKDMQDSQSTSESSDGIYFSDSASKIKIITESVNKNKRADPINLDVDLQSEDSASDSKLIDCAQHITVQSHSEKDIDPLIGVEQSASFPICDISNKKKHLMVNFSQENDHGENFSLPSGHFNMDNVIMNEMSNSHDASIAVYNRQINRKNGIFRRSLSHDPENDHKHHHNEIVPLHHDSKFVLQGHWNLFIQMELCDETLRDWIFKRNQSAVQLCDIFECVDTKINNGIFTQILTGLQFIHSKGLIHRDVKPRNIFLCKNAHAHLLPTVKIGDFGLATMRSIIQSLSTPPSYPASYHTAGVGTEPYASPEQMDGKKYGPKTDIYSLGVILFELYHPFSCEMERAKLLKLLPIVSKQFSSRRTGIALMIKPLMAADPSERPSINDMQKSSVFTRSREKKSKFTGEKKKRNIKELQIHNQKLETENSDLKYKLEQKDVMIKMLQDRLADIGYK